MIDDRPPAYAYQGDGVTTIFPFPASVENPRNIKVALTIGENETVLNYGQDYQVTLIQSTETLPTGEVQLLISAPATGTIITVARVTPIDQEVMFSKQGPYFASMTEGAFDKLTAIAQELGLASRGAIIRIVSLEDQVIYLTEGDKYLQRQINAEVLARTQGDSLLQGQLPGKADKSYVDSSLDGKANRIHLHSQSDIDGLTAALQGIGTALNTKASKDLATQFVAGLMSATDKSKLDNMSGSGAPIATLTVPGVVKPDGVSITIDPNGTIHSTGGGGGVTVHNALSGRDVPDAHTLGSISGLIDALAGKAPTTHSHEMSQVNGLATALASKAAKTELNDYALVTALTDGLASKADAAATAAALSEKASTAVATPSANGLMSSSDKIKLNNLTNSTIIGEIRLLPFRYTDLPTGWHYCNGGGYSTSSAVGQALAALPTAFKSDWGITVSGTTIYLPNLFSGTDGYFLRAVNGSTRQVGSKQADALQNMTGYVGSVVQYATPNGVFQISGASPGGVAAGTAVLQTAYMNAALQVRTAAETRSMNIGMTPAIYLGVA